MAVTLNSNGSYRADFMISDAAISQKAKQTQVSQDNGFAKLLDSRSSKQSKPVGSVNSSGSVSIASTYKAPEVKTELERVCEVPEKEALVLEPSEEMNIVRSEAEFIDHGPAIPEDTMELARAIVNGDIDINDVPIDRITKELLKAIMMVKKFENSDDDEDENEADKDVFDPASQYAVQEANAAMTLEDQIMALIMLVLDENSEEDELIAGVEGFLETLAVKPTETAASLAEDKIEAFEYAPVDEAVAAEKIAADVSEVVQAANGTNSTAQSKKTEVTAQAPGAESVAEGKVTVRKITQPEEKSDFSQQSADQNAAQNQQQSPISKEISEELEMLRNAKLGKAKTEAVESKTEDVQVKPEDVQIKSEDVQVKLEGVQGKSDAQGKSEDVQGKADEAVPVRTAAPLTADAPVMFAGRDGEMIQIRPSEVISQVTKIVEQVVSENREATEYSMVLNPEELGKITVKMVKAADGAVSITIVAENANTQRMLEQNGELMQSNLRANGVQLQSWQTVNEAHQETMQREYDGSSKNPYYREENAKSDDEHPDGESFADIIAAM